jgi:hypothetical protein
VSARKLKMWTGNYDGSREGLVIASSKERARKILGASRSEFDNYWSETPEVDPSLETEVLYTRPFTYLTAPPWHRGRCPLPDKEKC